MPMLSWLIDTPYLTLISIISFPSSACSFCIPKESSAVFQLT